MGGDLGRNASRTTLLLLIARVKELWLLHLITSTSGIEKLMMGFLQLYVLFSAFYTYFVFLLSVGCIIRIFCYIFYYDIILNERRRIRPVKSPSSHLEYRIYEHGK